MRTEYPDTHTTQASILHVGCGNSTLPERLYDDGYKRVVNIDVSESCIKAMIERNKEVKSDHTQMYVYAVTHETNLCGR